VRRLPDRQQGAIDTQQQFYYQGGQLVAVVNTSVNTAALGACVGGPTTFTATSCTGGDADTNKIPACSRN
jgi:hypothetical protein